MPLVTKLAINGFISSLLCVAALLAGCQSNNAGEGSGTGILRAGLPPSAQVVAEGTAQLTYTPEEPGQIYLYDMNRDRVVGRFNMRAGQRLALDGATGRATIDGNEVRVTPPRKNPGSYQIYYLRDPGPATRPA